MVNLFGAVASFVVRWRWVLFVALASLTAAMYTLVPEAEAPPPAVIAND